MESQVKNWTVKLPFLGRREKTTAELIILVLTEEWPLSSKGLFNRIKKQYLEEISFQGVHKAIKKLHSEQILVRQRRYYKLNSEWLEELGKFSKKVKRDYRLNATRLKDIP